MGSPAIVNPVDGLNHSTANVRELAMAERSIVNGPPDGVYTRYSAPSVGVCARQYPVEQRDPRGVTLARFTLREYLKMYPRFCLKLSHRGSGALQIALAGETHSFLPRAGSTERRDP